MPDTSPGQLEHKIKNIVVLMQENRSFDQVLGYLSPDGILTRSGQIRQDHVDGLLPGDNLFSDLAVIRVNADRTRLANFCPAGVRSHGPPARTNVDNPRADYSAYATSYKDATALYGTESRSR